MNSEIQGHKK